MGIEPELLQRVAAEIGDRAAWFEADVTDVAALGRAVDATVERFGGIDVVIANAGIAPFATSGRSTRSNSTHDRGQPAGRLAHGAGRRCRT